VTYLDSLNDVGWFVLCAILYAGAFTFTLVLCKAAALADRKQ
jgi:hypothetical protein